MPDLIFGHDTYLSPFTWRYGSVAMHEVWSEVNKRRLFRRVWVALATAQREAGLVTDVQLADLRAHQNDVDIERSAAIEAEIRHDLMAEVKVYSEQCVIGGGIIHLGATSMDISDNVEVLRISDSLDLLVRSLHDLLLTLAELVDGRSDQVCMAFTHLQPAEPTTVGYRLAQYAQDLLMDYGELTRVRRDLRGKGIKGAVGTSASYAALLMGTGVTPEAMENRVMTELGLPPFDVATQVYPRKQDWLVLNVLAGVAGSLYKFAFDLRFLQSPSVGEWGEPFGSRQVGSSAMPFKRNPVLSENIDSLARYVATLPRVAWDNAAHSLLERTLDDSGNRREVLPSAFLAVDEILSTAKAILSGLQVYEGAIARNLALYGDFAATERLLMVLVTQGANRQEMHEVIRGHAMAAWRAVQAGDPVNPLPAMLSRDASVRRYLGEDAILALFDVGAHIGDAPERARRMAQRVRTELARLQAA
ncbi:MAG: adenylosuccinate lyase [Anaerolineae bacterium]|nr:adenylosuccinate lyase [Anaerolineae bacterium]